jgi:hypothetical protein
MARKVFFSFHYDRDVRRVVQIRNSWVVRLNGEAQPFYDKAQWETIKRRGIEQWIEEQLAGTSVTVVLIGAETFCRNWVLHEIKRSYELKKGILGVYIHNVQDPQYGTDMKGRNPLEYWSITKNGTKVSFSSMYRTYDWVTDNGYNNFSSWVESAAKAVGR